MIDTSTPDSVGSWMTRMARLLQVQTKRCDRLDRYRRGCPPLRHASANVQSAFYQLQFVARTNFADLIVQAMTERMAVRSIRTAVAADDNGDQVAWGLWLANDMEVYQTDVYDYMGTFGVGYTSVAMGQDGEPPVIRAEDPRQVITLEDPVTRKTIAAFKLFHDDATDMDYAYLWRPGQMWVATKARKARMPSGRPEAPVYTPVTFDTQSFALSDQLSETYAVQDVPVVRYGNRKGVGEFELHIDLLDRINHIVLQRVVIATLQAYRQRALEATGEDPLPTHDDAGKEIDYDDLFSADPGAVWNLPPGTKIWESGQVDLSGVLASAKDDILSLAAVTRTPLSMFTPDAATQSAEGAQLQREGLVFKVEDRDRIAGRAHARTLSLALRFAGEDARAALANLLVDWVPAERFSLAERAQADAQAVSLPFEQKMRLVWQMSPSEVKIAKAQRAADAFLVAAMAPKPAPIPSPAPGPADRQPVNSAA